VSRAGRPLAAGQGPITVVSTSSLRDGCQTLARRRRILGDDFVEVIPSLDVRNTAILLAVGVVLNMIGATAHVGRIG
jgi:arginase family enzyme